MAVENKLIITRFHFLHVIIFLLVITTVPSNAQFSFYTDVNSYYDDNIYNNYLAEPDFINSFSFGSAYDVESEQNNLSMYYDGNLNFFNKNNAKSSNTHKAGIVNTYLINDNNPLNIGVNYSLKKFGEDYNIYNWQTISAYANYRHLTGENDFILAGYVFSNVKYDNMEILSYNEHKGIVKLQLAFETNTTLLISGEAAYKDYSQTYAYSDFTNNILQISSFIRIAQALGENTGLSVIAGLKKNLKEGKRYLNRDDFSYFVEEMISDQYSSDGFETGAKITQMLSPILILGGFVNFAQKYFTSLPAADLNGNSLSDNRQDKQLIYGLKLEVNMSSIISGLYGNVYWNYIHNNSNDPFYDYNNQIFAAGLEFGF